MRKIFLYLPENFFYICEKNFFMFVTKSFYMVMKFFNNNLGIRALIIYFSFVPIDIIYMHLFLWCFFIIKNYQKWVYTRTGVFNLLEI